MTALKNRLWHESRFHEEMTVNRPLNIEDVIYRASKFVKVEEEMSLLAKKYDASKKPEVS